MRLLGAVIDPQTRLGDIRIALASDPALRPGAFVRGEVIVDRAQRPVLPQTAVLSDAHGTYVFVLDPRTKCCDAPFEWRTPRRMESSSPKASQGANAS